jgi:hypothetical protein
VGHYELAISCSVPFLPAVCSPAVRMHLQARRAAWAATSDQHTGRAARTGCASRLRAARTFISVARASVQALHAAHACMRNGGRTCATKRGWLQAAYAHAQRGPHVRDEEGMVAGRVCMHAQRGAHVYDEREVVAACAGWAALRDVERLAACDRAVYGGCHGGRVEKRAQV